MVELGPVAIAVLHAVRNASRDEPPRGLTVTELTDVLGVDRRVLDSALGELSDAELIRLRGDVSTHRSLVELTDAGELTLDGLA